MIFFNVLSSFARATEVLDGGLAYNAGDSDQYFMHSFIIPDDHNYIFFDQTSSKMIGIIFSGTTFRIEKVKNDWLYFQIDSYIANDLKDDTTLSANSYFYSESFADNMGVVPDSVDEKSSMVLGHLVDLRKYDNRTAVAKIFQDVIVKIINPDDEKVRFRGKIYIGNGRTVINRGTTVIKRVNVIGDKKIIEKDL